MNASAQYGFAYCALRSNPLRPVPQHELLDLAGAGLRHLAEHDVAGAFVAGEAVAAPGEELLLRGRRPGFELDEGHGRLAPFLVGPRHYRTDGHGRVLVEHVLDLDGGDVLSP